MIVVDEVLMIDYNQQFFLRSFHSLAVAFEIYVHTLISLYDILSIRYIRVCNLILYNQKFY